MITVAACGVNDIDSALDSYMGLNDVRVGDDDEGYGVTDKRLENDAQTVGVICVDKGLPFL